MKRAFVLFLVVSILFCAVPALASDNSDRPTILFRGNPWGSTYEEVIASFPETIRWDKLDEDSSYSIADTMIGNHKKYFDGHVCCYTSPWSSSLDGFKVAGYDVSYIQLRFAYVPEDDGLLVKDADHTALFYAEYRIDSRDSNAAFEDLKNKLDELYGDNAEYCSPDYSYSEAGYMWKGNDGTMVVLSIDFLFSNPRVEIRYGFQGADDLLQAALDALAYGESLEAKMNYSGL